MADTADAAADLNETMMAVHLHNARRPTPGVVAIGECLYCDEPLNDGRRWCNSTCRDSWEKEHG